MKKTAVEWLIESHFGSIENCTNDYFRDKINQAIEMEKQQIIDAHFEGVKKTVLNLSEHIDIPKTLKNVEEIENGIGKHEEGEEYYNEQFKNK